MNPKESQCAANSATNSVTANLNNFKSFKNAQGVYMWSIGDVKLNNFLVADNTKTGIEVAQTPHTPDGTAELVNAVIIAHSDLASSTDPY